MPRRVSKRKFEGAMEILPNRKKRRTEQTPTPQLTRKAIRLARNPAGIDTRHRSFLSFLGPVASFQIRQVIVEPLLEVPNIGWFVGLNGPVHKQCYVPLTGPAFQSILSCVPVS